MNQKLKTQIELPHFSHQDNLNGQAASIFRNLLQKQKKIIILSPHLDDAVLSAGSLISFLVKQDIELEVITVFTEGSKLLSTATKQLLRNANFNDSLKYFQARRSEDVHALKMLSVNSFEHLGFIDSAWRTFKNGSAIYDDSQLATIHEQEKMLYNKIVNRFKRIFDKEKDVCIVAPLARGRHIDHQIVRNVASGLAKKIMYYEDFPYSSLYGNENEFIAGNNLSPFIWKGDYESKKKAILEYATQQFSLFSRGIIELPYERYYSKSF